MDTILFDLDGTLLPMDEKAFTELYFGALALKGKEMGIEPKLLIHAIYEGIKAMVANQGQETNEAVFWNTMVSIIGKDVLNTIPVFERFYQNEFYQVKAATKPRPEVKTMIAKLREKGYRLILATNPLFPQIATHTRMQWAGLDPADFVWVTTYENASFAKPNPAYYEEILKHHGIHPDQCMMIGNDMDEDMVAATLGLKTFLVTDCLIQRREVSYPIHHRGTFEELIAYLDALPDLSQA